MNFTKKKLIIIGVALLLLIIAVVLTSNRTKKTNTTAINSVKNKDFDTKEEVTPTLIPIPTIKPTLVPTLKPTLIPTPTKIPTPTRIPTRKPTLTPTRVPTKIPTPTPDNNVYATGVVLSLTELSLKINESHQINYRVEPNETTNKTVYWSSSNEGVALVTSDGWIIGKNTGEATITARTSNNKGTSVHVKVNLPTPTLTPTLTPTPILISYPTKIDLSLIRLILKINETKQLYVKYQPENVADKTVTWSTSDNTVITVNNTGLVTAKKAGTATVTVVTENNLIKTATVVVYK